MATSTLFENAPKPDFTSSPWNWTFNATHYVPSARDLALAGPRIFMKIGSFLAFPEAVDNILGGGRLGARIIPAATGGGGGGMVDAATTAAAVSGEAIAAENLEDAAAGISSRFTMEGVRSLGNVFSYATSKWALACIVVAVILNRTFVYASTRRNLTLPWKIRFVLRLTPIILLTLHARSLLQSIQCQSSPDFGELRWGNKSKTAELMFTQNGGFLHELSQGLLFGAGDRESCEAVRMVAPLREDEEEDGKRVELTGSLSLLWPLFKTFSFSQFIETVSCAVQGRPVAGETGMTLFEHSLAFAEAEGAVGNQIGFGSFGSMRNFQWTNTSSDAEATKIAITRSMIMKKVNTTPEVLLVGFLSTMNHLTSHILAVFNLQGRFRLINTGIWGLSFMSAIVWSIWTFSIDDIPNQSLLRFPTVCIIGFIPHVLVLFGIIGCSFIYAIALCLSAVAPPAVDENAEELPQSQWPFMRRIMAAHHNMQANIQLSGIRVSLHMDFYTALLRTGFSILTMASEAVYLNESNGVNVKQRTWLEDERLKEIEAFGAQWLGPQFKLHQPGSGHDDGSADGVGLVAADDQPMDLLQKSTSGYAKEMTAKKASKIRRPETAGLGVNGVGATERSGRWLMALEYLLAISRLVLLSLAAILLKCLTKIGITYRPRFLVYLAAKKKPSQGETVVQETNDPDSLRFYLLDKDGELTLPKDENVDVEAEMRARMKSTQGRWDDAEEKNLDNSLYNWWLHNGWWGSDDNSGSFAPGQQELDEDITSVVSFSTTEDEREWESDSGNDDGRRTPTQEHPRFIRESSPFTDTPLNASDLAQLLNPKTPEQRSEAATLAAHLSSSTILTRSKYRHLTQRDRAKVLTSTLHRPSNFKSSSPTGKLTPEEESQILEHLIISRRSFHSSTTSDQPTPTSWSKGASGLGENGPQCVVCQSVPRSIIVWPCRCLSLCDDCRVTLAMNNFDKCVCCRRDVASFSRIFVP